MNTASIAAPPSADGAPCASDRPRCEVKEVDDDLCPAEHAPLESQLVAFQVGLVPQAVAQARSAARQAFTAWILDLDDPAVDTAIVVLSELVTNAVKHARLLCKVADVTLGLVGCVLSVSVHDRHPYRPRALPAPHSDGRGGRGLALVRDLVAEAGGRTSVPIDADRHGKSMCVEIPIRSALLAAERPSVTRAA